MSVERPLIAKPNFYVWFTIFLFINFGTLFVGNLMQGNGPDSKWYLELEKPPWTPPGWAFPVAWTSIMFCFSIFMAAAIRQLTLKQIAPWFVIQIILNAGWNALFFQFHQVTLALVDLVSLSFLIATVFALLVGTMRWTTVLLIPYLVWLLVAISINTFILFFN